MTNAKLRIITGTMALIVVYTFVQQGPLFLSKATQYPVQFVAESPRKFVADLSDLPSGKYFVSVGRTLGDTEIYLNDVLLQRGQLTAGVPIDLSDKREPKCVSIVWLAKEEWRKYLFDQPVVTGYGIGFLIQEWRKFVGLFLGPLSSLALIIFALFNHRVSKGQSSQFLPHLVCGASGFIYGLFLAGIPDLFFSFSINLPYQIALRIVLSGAITYLISTYGGRQFKALFGLHAAGVALVVALSFAKQDWLIVLYKAELVFFVFATLIPTITLMRMRDWTSEIELMICLGLSLTFLEAFAGVVYIFFGPSSWTVWSPSFISVLAITNFYFIYKKAVTRSIEVQLSKRYYYLAAQIAHDVRSPLAALNAIVHNSDGVEESVRVQIKNVVARIRDIANNLLRSGSIGSRTNLNDASANENVSDGSAYGLSCEVSQGQLISHRLSSLVSEKRLQYSDRKGIEIYFNVANSGLPHFVNMQPVEFGRVLSNLIYNAVRAVGENGKVTVDLKGDETHVQIIVEDTGTGMPSEVLGKIGTRGYSYGKGHSESGSGLGVYHAMETIKSWSGQLKYETKLSKGTKAIISLPRVKAPDWFVESISIMTPATIIVLDVDPSVIDAWRDRFRSAGLSQVQVIGFGTSRDLIQWYRDSLDEVEHHIYICDYELGGKDLKGLDVIQMLGIAANAILVTHQWDDVDVRNRCIKLGVKILPKDASVVINANGVAIVS